ncbi:MAG: YqjF family protein [Flavobacteriales bacterium]
MASPKEILEAQAHRPWPLPAGRWSYYQEWNRVLFLHWKVAPELLQPHLPAGLPADLYEGQAWVSLVAFTMEHIRPRLLPAFSFISDFHEINLRTYVTHKNKPGVYFLNIEAGKALSAQVSRALSGLPYEKSEIVRKTDATRHIHRSVFQRKGFYLNADLQLRGTQESRTALDSWLTERYCLYQEQNGRLYSYDIHHAEWPLRRIEISDIQLDYHIGALHFQYPADLVHYSDGVQVLAWGQKNVSL